MLHELNACARKRNGFQKRKKFIEINTVHMTHESFQSARDEYFREA